MDKKIVEVALENLWLDEENPRLPESVSRDQNSMLDYIAESTSIDELMSVIAQNGYFPGEPLIVVPRDTEDGGYTVVEGNRRLTALKILQDPSVCSDPSLRMQDIVKLASFKPTQIPVVIQEKREDVLPYLGYRHITGIKQWEPLSKARYIGQLFHNTDAKDEARVRYGEIAQTIGSRRDHIKRNLDALAIYEEIEEHDFYGIENLDEKSIKFSVLSTALADTRIANFVGIAHTDADGNHQQGDPFIDKTSLKKEAVSDLIRWLFEPDEQGKTKVGESRNIRQLSAVVNSPKALKAFRDGASLRTAYYLTEDNKTDFINLLYQAESALIEAAGMVANVPYSEEAMTASRRVRESIASIGLTLKSKQEKRPEDDF